MTEPVWITRASIQAIHDELLSEFEGEPGIRKEDFLAAALSRPRHLYACGEHNLCVLAAAYSLGIARNTPFHDGNRRTAFMAAYVFLRTNGRELVVENSHATEIIMDLAAGEMSEEEYAEWLQEHLALD